MSEGQGPDNGKPGGSQQGDDALSQRLRDLDRRITQVKPEVEPEAEPQERRKGMALAFRLSADFVAGVLVGAAIGWGLDWLLGSSPWGLIVFLLLGFAAGVLNVLRSAGLVAPRPGIDDDPAGRRFG